MAEIHKFTSRYKGTPIKDFYLDLWEEIVLESSSNDNLMEISARYHQRPDLLSFDLYGTPRLWWLFALRNPDILVDPIGDFMSGLLIYTPTRNAVEKLATR